MATPRVVDLRLEHPLRCVAVRPAPRSAGSGGGAQQQPQAQQVLLFTDGGCFELLGLDGAGGGAGGGAGSAAGAGVRVGPAVPLRDADNAEWPCDEVRYATYDASSSSLYATTDAGLVRIDAEGRVTDPLSGYDRLPFDIKGLEAIAVDHLGIVYVAAEEELCMLLLPSRQAGQVAGAEAHGAGGGLIQLTSANLDGGGLQYVAYDPRLGRLYVATDRAIYGVRGTTAALLAGGTNGGSGMCRDGAGCRACFRFIRRVMPGHDGCLYVVDGRSSLQLRKVTPDGVVSTLQQLD
ncbi:hypothetical protein TSOC_013288 [Tetrabaena socialis]|uniref:Uncharacterized protein n=1 Tax=Tetrabaena socialis TaxID=47790 RepID=A0A2J7ZKT0_9CHLO|nr:hypothetical protein TSOC_013288 [Tetrabaena socialis]|eukprot:PNH00874.1 hypothetical protein TSOC_013288 [Tetrabaena socialis]